MLDSKLVIKAIKANKVLIILLNQQKFYLYIIIYILLKLIFQELKWILKVKQYSFWNEDKSRILK